MAMPHLPLFACAEEAESAAGRMPGKARQDFSPAGVLAALAGCNSGSWSSGDRVLVSKVQYESGLGKPRRFDVVVFKFPETPLKKGVPTNYIKRLVGLPAQILDIFVGQFFFFDPCEEGEPPPFNDLANPKVDNKDLWHKQYMHIDDPSTKQLFEAGRFTIVRKPPDVMMALRRIVYDNDFQATDLGRAFKRWAPSEKSAWKIEDDYRAFSHAGDKGAGIDWLRYQHLIPPSLRPKPPDDVKPSPELITDFESYNQIALRQLHAPPEQIRSRRPKPNWVGDLMVECKVQVEKAEGFFYMELTKGINRFPPPFNLAKVHSTLLNHDPKGVKEDQCEEMASQPPHVQKPGTYLLRFANFDARLTVWVDRQMPFGDGQGYP